MELILPSYSEESGTFPGLWEISKVSEGQGSLGFGLSQQKVQAAAAQKLGASDLQSIILKVISHADALAKFCIICFKIDLISSSCPFFFFWVHLFFLPLSLLREVACLP